MDEATSHPQSETLRPLPLRITPGGDTDYAPWEGKQMGSYGEGAGAAYVFSGSPAAEGYVWGQDQVGAAAEQYGTGWPGAI